MPSVQKKTGPVAGDLKESEAEDGEADEDKDEEVKAEAKPRGGKKKKVKAKREDADDEEEAEAELVAKATKSKKRSVKHENKVAEPKAINSDYPEAEEHQPASKKRKANTKVETNSEAKSQKGRKVKLVGGERSNERRRSARVSRNGK